jgi:hypothetical protein
VSITINPEAPAATVGAGQTICALGTTTSLGGNAASPGVGAWSVVSGGTGTFSNAASETSTFTHLTGAGPVVIRWTITNAPCASTSADVSITITPAPSATISYSGSPYCSNAGTASVSFSGTTGGVYTSMAGLTIDGSTGDVTLGTSTAGTYTVTYTVAAAGGCAQYQTTASITITAAPSASISYSGSPYCSNAGTASVSFSGTTGGTYSSTAGLSINASTGDVTLTTSSAGTYTVTYTVAAAGGCPQYQTTASITVNAAPVVNCPSNMIITNTTPPFTLTGGSQGNAGVYSGPGVSGTGPYTFTPANGNPGSNTITYTYTDGNGCTNSCTFTIAVGNMVLVLETDASADVVTWEVRTTPGNVLAASGNGPYAASTTYTLPFYLANGDYVLSVFDSAGDGLCCMNGTGGFILRTSGGARFIDANNSGIFTSTASVALGFTLPMGANFNQLTASRCDRENYLPSDFIQCGEDPAVTAQYGVTNSTSGYQFWIFDPNGGYSRRVLMTHATASTTYPAGPARCSYLRFSQLTTNPVPNDKLLNVRIRSLVAGVYNNFGPACRVKIDLSTNCPTTQLLNNVADPRHSCGITGVMLNGSRTLYAVAVSAANKYQFEFVKSGYLRRIASPTSSLNLTVWATSPLQYGFTYDVKVRASFDNGANYCPFGATCQITTAAGPENPGHGMEAMAEGSGLQMWPNPNGEGRVYLRLEGLSESTELVTVDIYDLMGSKVQTATLVAGAGVLNESLDLSKDIARGVYVVNLTADGQVFTKRLVVE